MLGAFPGTFSVDESTLILDEPFDELDDSLSYFILLMRDEVLRPPRS